MCHVTCKVQIAACSLLFRNTARRLNALYLDDIVLDIVIK